MLEAKLLNLIALEQFFGGRTIAVIFNNDRSCVPSPTMSKKTLSSFAIIAPAARLGGPDHAIALNLALLMPSGEIVDRRTVLSPDMSPRGIGTLHLGRRRPMIAAIARSATSLAGLTRPVRPAREAECVTNPGTAPITAARSDQAKDRCTNAPYHFRPSVFPPAQICVQTVGQLRKTGAARQD